MIEVRFVLRSDLEMEEVSAANLLPRACNRIEATRQEAHRVTMLDHEAIMEEAERSDRLKYDEETKSEEELLESELESDSK